MLCIDGGFVIDKPIIKFRQSDLWRTSSVVLKGIIFEWSSKPVITAITTLNKFGSASKFLEWNLSSIKRHWFCKLKLKLVVAKIWHLHL